MQHDTTTRSTAEGACEEGGNRQLAMGLLAEMAKRVLRQNTITCITAMSACEKR